MNRKPSAPPAHRFLGHIPDLRDDVLGFLRTCAHDYGPIVPLRLPFIRAVLLLDPTDIERVLVTEHRNFIKPVWLRTAAVRRLLGDGLVTSDGESWRRQRRECHRAFHPNLLPGYADTFTVLAGRMLDGWEHGEERDVLRDMARLTLQIVVRTMLGTDAGEAADEISESMDTIMAHFSAPYRLFGLAPIPPAIAEIAAVRKLDCLVERLIEDAGDLNPFGDETLLKSLMAAEGHPDRKRYLREQIKTFLAAGHESSALTLTWAFALLAQHPNVGTRLSKELETVLGDRTPKFSDLPDLPYTLAIIKETLRLFPPLWMTGRRAVTDCEVGGQKVPGGTLVLTSQWAVQRSPRYFHAPDSFHPERWEDLANLPRFAYFPFGGGPRICIGQNFAVAESVLLLASVARRFRLELTAEEEVRPWATMTLRPPAGLTMRVTARSHA